MHLRSVLSFVRSALPCLLMVQAIALPSKVLAAGNGVPSATRSTCPGCGGPESPSPFIQYVGFQHVGSDRPHQATQYDITIRDTTGFPVAGAVVIFNSVDCLDLVLCENLPSPPASQWNRCSPPWVYGNTNSLGKLVLNPIGAGRNSGRPGSPSNPPGCVEISADGILLARASAVVFDQNGALSASWNGVSALDYALVRADLAEGKYRSRSDYSSRDGCTGGMDCGVLSALDLSYFQEILRESTDRVGSGAGCSNRLPSNYCPY